MKIYIKEKDLNGATSCQFNGECYSLTGGGKTKSQVTATDISQVTTQSVVEMALELYSGPYSTVCKFNIYPNQDMYDYSPVTFLDPAVMAQLRSAGPNSQLLRLNAANNDTSVAGPTDWDQLIEANYAFMFRTTYGQELMCGNGAVATDGETCQYYTPDTPFNLASDENIVAVGVKAKNFTL